MRNAITITRRLIHPKRWVFQRRRSASADVVMGVDPMGIRLKEGET